HESQCYNFFVKLHAFVPGIVRLYDRNKPWAEWLPGTLLFADISGFTPMTAALSLLGPEGCEVLSGMMNRYFSEMISIIHSHQGDVLKFGGDSLLCFFPGDDSLPRTLWAAHRMRESMKKFRNLRTPAGRFTLRMKTGIATGEVLLAGIGDPDSRCD